MRWPWPLLLLAATPVTAEIIPHPGGGDPHIQQVNYDPEQVVALRAAPGFAITVELSPDERIENIAVGNSSDWQIQSNRRGDHLFIKPLGAGGPTNMTVITDARRYNFLLEPGTANDPTLPYSVRFLYPVAANTPDTLVEPTVTRFKLHGDRSIWPVAISDDGQSTSIVWSADETMPAVYRVDDHGRETLVNGLVRDGAYVIQGVSHKFIFKLGKKSASATSIKHKARRK